MLPGGAGRRMPSRGILGRTETSSPGGSTHSSSSHPSQSAGNRSPHQAQSARRRQARLHHGATHLRIAQASPTRIRHANTAAQEHRPRRCRGRPRAARPAAPVTTGVPRTAPPGRAEPPRPVRPAFPRASSLPRLRGRRHRQDARPRRRCLGGPDSRCRGLRACPARRLGHGEDGEDRVWARRDTPRAADHAPPANLQPPWQIVSASCQVRSDRLL
jgi:hypothetical protein